MTLWPSTDAHQGLIPLAYFEEHDHMPFKGQQIMQNHPCILQDFQKICLRVKIRSVVLRFERKLCWLSFSGDFTVSRHFLPRRLA